MTLPNNKPFRDSIEQYFTMNKDMKYLGEEGESYSVRTLNKQIIKMLPPRVRMAYIMSNGEEQDTKEDILDAMESLDTFVKLRKMVNASENAVSNKNNGGNQNSKNPTENPTVKPTKEATIRRRIRARSTKESTIGANAQTTNSQRASKATMAESQSTLMGQKQRRKLCSRKTPRTKPTLFKKKLKRTSPIIITLWKMKMITR